jgi:hypothetical protein
MLKGVKEIIIKFDDTCVIEKICNNNKAELCLMNLYNYCIANTNTSNNELPSSSIYNLTYKTYKILKKVELKNVKKKEILIHRFNMLYNKSSVKGRKLIIKIEHYNNKLKQIDEQLKDFTPFYISNADFI